METIFQIRLQIAAKVGPKGDIHSARNLERKFVVVSQRSRLLT